jgi:hypothetical protein
LLCPRSLYRTGVFTIARTHDACDLSMLHEGLVK